MSGSTPSTPPSGRTGAAGPVDWRVAARVAARLAPPGPTASRTELVDLVESLRAAAPVALGHAARISRLEPADGRDPARTPVSTVRVVDRASWARANARSLAALLDGAPRTGRAPTTAARASAGMQLGGALAALSGAVLGQYDPFGAWPAADRAAAAVGGPADAGAAARRGGLLVVAPNLLALPRSLGVDPDDFRLWVLLHEQTHALQFAAAPWLVGHLVARAGELLADDEPRRGRDRRRRSHDGRLGHDGRDAGRAGRGARRADPADPADLADPAGAAASRWSLLDLLDPDRRRAVDELGAVMALLEGHADVTMDAVGRSVVPSVRRLRTRFDARRAAGARATGVRRAVRGLLGLDVKLAQYREGAAFVRGVRRRVGIDGLNVVWTGPAQLPTAAEIADPAAWVRRVHG